MHGFVAGRSVVSNLLLYQDFINSAIEEGSQVDAVYTDFKKTFDSVDYTLLLCKLRAFGIDGSMLKWLSSFITNRSQVVKFKNCFSRIINATSGVPQGSHLGPLLFNIFINDIKEVFTHCKFLLYADDLKVFCRINRSDEADLMQLDLSRLGSWSNINNLHFNLSKCSVIHFSQKRKSYI